MVLSAVGGSNPYVTFNRHEWSDLAASTPLPLTEQDVRRLRTLGDQIELAEVDAIFRPLSRLLHLHAAASRRLYEARQTFLHDESTKTPYVIGVAGSVAVGKSTTSRLLRELMARWPDTPNVALVPTDGFLLPNSELERRGLMDRKGFPESYDRTRLLRFLIDIKSGAAEVAAPVYSHLTYDIVPGESTLVRSPDILIVEGLNVLQPARTDPEGRPGLAVSDFFDFSIYIDAAGEDIREWYIERFGSLRATAFADARSYFRRYADLSDAEARRVAGEIWDTINAPNLRRNILPTRSRATLVLTKAANHHIAGIRLRKI
ncbi:MAG: type I pantothenate kinase [Bifidobacteriaceae bacterium]|nr:type I pantothenate kinase [Bifidobacteriaceae bacterium]